MSDIVERLRDNSRRTSYRPGVDDLILEAADEIERLRELLRKFDGYYRKQTVGSYHMKHHVWPAVDAALCSSDQPSPDL